MKRLMAMSGKKGALTLAEGHVDYCVNVIIMLNNGCDKKDFMVVTVCNAHSAL